MSEGHEYFRIGGIDISPDNKIMAYSVDTVSRRLYTVYFKNLQTGITSSQSISNTSGGISWANDNKTIFYNQKNVNIMPRTIVFVISLVFLTIAWIKFMFNTL